MSRFPTHTQDREYTLSELVSAARDLLQQADPEVADERVTLVPDKRVVRYYQSSGIVDRPARYEGRSAIYGTRHLLQVVCVKLLQARGLSLAQVQRALAGATDARLEEAVSDALEGSSSEVEVPSTSTPRTPPRLVSVEVAPGIVLTVDPRVVDSPEAVVQLVQRTLRDGGSS